MIAIPIVERARSLGFGLWISWTGLSSLGCFGRQQVVMPRKVPSGARTNLIRPSLPSVHHSPSSSFPVRASARTTTASPSAATANSVTPTIVRDRRRMLCTDSPHSGNASGRIGKRCVAARLNAELNTRVGAMPLRSKARSCSAEMTAAHAWLGRVRAHNRASRPESAQNLRPRTADRSRRHEPRQRSIARSLRALRPRSRSALPKVSGSEVAAPDFPGARG
jgi:hypothetical protein